MATKAIINMSLPMFCMEMEAAFEEGFRINPDNPPCTWGIAYECVLVRDDYAESIADAFEEAQISGGVRAGSMADVTVVKKSNAGRPAKVKQ